MIPANDAIPVSDIVRIRSILRDGIAKLLAAQDDLAGQIAALDAVEHQARAVALREGSRFLDASADSEALRHHGELQRETNANFRQIHEAAAELRIQIAALLRQQERLYEATFANEGGVAS